MKIRLLYLCWLAAGVAQAQVLRFAAPVAAPARAGYYCIALPPAALGRLRPDYADLRLRNAAGQDVPYLPERRWATAAPGGFRAFTTRVAQSPGQTIVWIDRGALTRPEVVLRVANAATTKPYAVEGSPDDSRWFALLAGQTLQPEAAPGDTLRSLALPLPQSGYRYLRLRIADSASAPLNVRGAGYYTQSGTQAPVFDTLPAPLGLASPSHRNGQSRWLLQWAQPFSMGQLHLWFTGPPAYDRACRVSKPDTFRRKRRVYPDTVYLYEARATSLQMPTVMELPGQELPTLVLDVEDGDSPPLTLTQALALSPAIDLIAYLKPGERYTLAWGHPDLQPPRYDLARLRARLPLQPGRLYPGPITDRGQGLAATVAAATERQPWLLWTGIAAVALVVGTLAFRMLRDMAEEV